MSCNFSYSPLFTQHLDFGLPLVFHETRFLFFLVFGCTYLFVVSNSIRCVITGNGGAPYAYLGRPWGPFGRVVFAYTYMDACIRDHGWNNWGKPENERSACFYEYRYFIASITE